MKSSKNYLNYFFSSSPNGRYGHRVTKLFVSGGISHYNFEIVWKPLQPCPFAWSHFSNSLPIYFSFDAGLGRKIGETVVINQVTFAAHSTYHNGIGNALVGDYLIPKTIAFAFMSLFMIDQCFEVLR